MRITTSGGIVIEVGRVDRRELDKFAAVHPAPRPPVKIVKAWGGADEEVEDESDPAYIRQAVAYRVMMVKAQFGLLSDAMNVVDYDWTNDANLLELVEAGIAEVTKNDYLRFVALADNEDLRRVTDEILYLSTVTERGIQEASSLYDVTWYGQPISKYRIKTTPGLYSRIFEERKAANYSQYSWNEFCNLWGYEQSAIVAFFRLDTRLDYLIQREKK